MSKDLALQKTEWDLHETPEAFVPLEFTEEIKPEIFGLELSKAQEMTSGLSTTLAEREVLKNAYIDVIGLEITTDTLPTFKELRLKIVKNRTQGIEKWHKENKAFYLAGGRFVDAIKNKEIVVNEEMESKLLEAEKFFENQEKEKARLINESRIERLKTYVEDTTSLDFAPMSDEDFDDYLLGKKTRFENEQKEREAEALRIETERLAEIERQKGIEIENAKLKAEVDAKEKIRKERGVKMQPYMVYIRDYNKLLEMSDIDFEKEIKAIHKGAMDDMKYQAEKLQAEEKERNAEAKRKQQEFEKAAEIRLKEEIAKKAENDCLAKIEAEKLEAEKLSKAPIKKQLTIWVDNFSIPVSEIKHEKRIEIEEKFFAFKKWAKSEIDKL